MPKLTQRAIKPELFVEGRLLAVSRGARMLAVGLEAMAEPTGCVARNVREIRATVGYWLAEDPDSNPPSQGEIDTWIEELIRQRWLVEDTLQSPTMLYLKGFGDRQQSQYVYVGVSDDGVLKPYLSTPCVEVRVENITKKEGGRPVLRGYPVHCEQPYSACPCSRMLSGATPDALQTGSRGSSERESGSEGVSESESETKSSETRARSNRSGSPRENLDVVVSRLLADFESWQEGGFTDDEVRVFVALCSEYGPAAIEDAKAQALTARVTSPIGLRAFLPTTAVRTDSSAQPHGDGPSHRKRKAQL